MRFAATVRAASTPVLPATAVIAFAAMVAVSEPVFAQVHTNAHGEQSRALRDRGGATRNLPPVGRYASESGNEFVLDQSGAMPLLRFERSAETWVLRPSAAPRGDVIYRNDAGDQILRITPDGGITLYTRREPNGSPVSRVGGGESLAAPVLGPVQLFNLMNRRSGMVSQALGRLVQINLPDVQSEALSVEALVISTDAVIRMSRAPVARQRLERLRSITIVEGGRANVVYSRGDLRVTIDPSQGQAGRPSSTRVIQAFAPRD